MTECSFLCEFHTEKERFFLSAIPLCGWMDSCPCVVVRDTCHQEVFLRHRLRGLNMECSIGQFTPHQHTATDTSLGFCWISVLPLPGSVGICRRFVCLVMECLRSDILESSYCPCLSASVGAV